MRIARILMAPKAELKSKHLHFDVASTFDNLGPIVEETEQFMCRLCDDEDLCYRVVLLTSEAITNAIEHGNSLDPDKRVIMDLTAYPDRVELCVQDEGAGFEAHEVADPLHDDNVLIGRGRGLFFMGQFADEVHPELSGRRMRLVFYRSP